MKEIRNTKPVDLQNEIALLRNRGPEQVNREENIVRFEWALWKIVYDTVRSPFYASKEIPFLGIDQSLCNAIAKSSTEAVAQLASPSVCSFQPHYDADTILNRLGRTHSSDRLELNFNDHREGSFFATIYWNYVRNIASYSPADCIAFFGLRNDLVEALFFSNVWELCEFYLADVELLKFDLSCPAKICINILNIAQDPTLDRFEKKALLIAERLRKDTACQARK